MKKRLYKIFCVLCSFLLLSGQINVTSIVEAAGVKEGQWADCDGDCAVATQSGMSQGTATTTALASLGFQMMGGIPIGGTTKYLYSTPDPTSAYAVCKTSKPSPEQYDNVTVMCAAYAKAPANGWAWFIPPVQQATLSTDKPGLSSVTLNFNGIKRTCTPQGTSMVCTSEPITLTATVSASVYSGISGLSNTDRILPGGETDVQGVCKTQNLEYDGNGGCICKDGGTWTGYGCSTTSTQCGTNKVSDGQGGCKCITGLVENANHICQYEDNNEDNGKDNGENNGGENKKCDDPKKTNVNGVCVCATPQYKDDGAGGCALASQDAVCSATETKKGNTCQCNNGYEKVNGVCKTKCSTNEERNVNGVCACKSGYGRSGSTCVACTDPSKCNALNDCQADEEKDINGVCQKTGDKKEDTACASGERYKDGKCYAPCKQDEERDEKTNTCSPIKNNTSCTSLGKILYNGVCRTDEDIKKIEAGEDPDASKDNDDPASQLSDLEKQELLDAINEYGNSSNDFNSSLSDWAGSTGGSEGTSDLDEYFDTDLADILGLSEDELAGLGDDLTTDLGINNFTQGVEDAEKFMSDNGMMSEDGSINMDAVNDFINNGGDYSAYANSSEEDNTFDSILDILNNMNKAGVDSTEDSEGNYTNKNTSMSQMLKNFMSGDDNSIFGAETASEQQLFELAQKFLKERGYSLEDLLKGKNYDMGSAYTDVDEAWDMNRITTLMKTKKLKLSDEELKKMNELKKTKLSSAINYKKDPLKKI